MAEQTQKKNELIEIMQRVPKPEFVNVDDWDPEPEDLIFDHARGSIIANIGKVFGIEEDSDINYFVMSPKRCYNSDIRIKYKPPGKSKNVTEVVHSLNKATRDRCAELEASGIHVDISAGYRDHCTTYLNYFEKFFDREHWLFNIYAKIKFMIDYQEGYTEQNFLNDLVRYIINYEYNPRLHYQLGEMNEYNYYIHLTYRNKNHPCLEYTDKHAKIFMEISLLENMVIPLASHFSFKNNYVTNDVDRLMIRCFDKIFSCTKNKYGVDIFQKLYETTETNVDKNVKNNSVVWGMQDIRGKTPVTHTMDTVIQIIKQIIPKYTYSKNIIHFNFNAIGSENKYKVTDIPYEFQLASVSSSNRDEDNNSEADKFEAHIAKIDEAMLLQTNVNCDTTMKNIIQMYGPFNPAEIAFYEKELTKDGKPIKNSFQANLISYLFLKEFKDTRAVKITNNEQYIILMIAAKRYLCREGQTLLPFILGGKVEYLVTKKIVNKKILKRIEISELYPQVKDKYRNDKINEDNVFKNIAQLLASQFRVIDFYHPEINGKLIEVIPEKICEEMLQFVLMI